MKFKFAPIVASKPPKFRTLSGGTTFTFQREAESIVYMKVVAPECDYNCVQLSSGSLLSIKQDVDCFIVDTELHIEYV